jgi:hypothetical protein
MSNETQAPIAGMPDFDPKADRGSEFKSSGVEQVVELSADELKAIGKAPAEEVKEPVKEPAKEPAKEAEKPADKGDVVTEPAKGVEPVKEAAKEEAKEPAKEPAKVEEPLRDEKGKFIPKARFDEVNNKAKAKVALLEAENKALRDRIGVVDGKAPDTAALEAELDAKSAAYSKFVADGQLDDANAAMKEINRINRQIGNIEATRISGEHQEESANVDVLTELVGLYKDAYPVFDDANTEVYKQEYVDFVASLQGRFEMTGSSPAEALREAVELAVAKFGLDPAPAAADPAAPATPAKTKADERKESGVDAALKAAAAQPPSTAKVGEDSDKAGMTKISIEQISDYKTFESLAKSESTLKRLRGDLA